MQSIRYLHEKIEVTTYAHHYPRRFKSFQVLWHFIVQKFERDVEHVCS